MSSATTIAAIAGVASAGIGAAGAYQQSQAAKSQANYQSQVASTNATIAQQNAARLQQYGIISDGEQRKRIADTKAAARARLAANGLLVDDTVGTTATGLQVDLAEAGALDILKLQANYREQIQAAQVQGVNYQAEAGLASLKASQQNPGFALAGSLLSSAGSVYSAGKKAGWGGGGGSTSYSRQMSIMDI